MTVDILSPEETLVVNIARATCFAARFPSGQVPEAEIALYVDELDKLFQEKPHSMILHGDKGDRAESLESVLIFCAEQLASKSPRHSAKLREALRTAVR